MAQSVAQKDEQAGIPSRLEAAVGMHQGGTSASSCFAVCAEGGSMRLSIIDETRRRNAG